MKETIFKKLDWLRNANFGQADAEHEHGRLSDFFIKTYAWQRLLRGDVDIIHGTKGSGKSALYAALVHQGRDELQARGIQVINGNHLDLIDQLPEDVPEGFNWSDFWFCYILILCAGAIMQKNMHICPEILNYLTAKQLLDNNPNNRLFLARLSQFVWETRGGLSHEEVFRRSSMSSGSFVGTQMADTVISHSSHVKHHSVQPSADIKVSWSSLLQHLHAALAAMGLTFWVALDKLDVVFRRLPHIEIDAVNGLLRCHEDMKGFSHIRLRLFLQTQAFRRALQKGVTNPDHLATSSHELSWDIVNLKRLLILRLLNNPCITEYLSRRVPRDAELITLFHKPPPLDVIIGNVLDRPNKQDAILRAVFGRPNESSLRDTDKLDSGDNSIVSKFIRLLAVDESEYNPRDFVILMHHAALREIHFLETEQHEGMWSLISTEAVEHALNEIAVEKLRTLISRYNGFSPAALGPMIWNLKEGIEAKHRVAELVAAWTGILGGDKTAAREALRFCYESRVFRKNQAGYEELLRGDSRRPCQFTITPIYTRGLKAITESELLAP